MASSFNIILSNLADNQKDGIKKVFEEWDKDARLKQIRINIESETGLSDKNFADLLADFISKIKPARNPTEAWIEACRSHKFLGRLVPKAQCPVTLARARSLDDYAKAVAKSSGPAGITPEEAKRQFIKFAGNPVPDFFSGFIRAAPLGRFAIWATFDSRDSNNNPFKSLPLSHSAIITALGLGFADVSLVLIVWGHIESGEPPLYRPTIADAEDYHFFRPNPATDALCGLTFPLQPNPLALAPQTELVLPQILGTGLRLPFEIVHA